MNFLDIDIFDIFLCLHGDEDPKSCKLLYEGYMPSKHIVPLQPCQLTVNHSSSLYHFIWESCYEDYLPNYILIYALMYQLRFYKRGHEEDGTTVHATQESISLDDDNFEPDSKYAARVRSSPDQVTYKGHWSEWSSEVLWKTAPPKTTASLLLDKRWTIPMCVMLPLLLLLCFRPVKELRKNVLIPTPAPYFQTLYSDCQGDFKAWVVTPSMDVLMTEETLRIDTLAKSINEQEEDGSSDSVPCLIEGDPLGWFSHQAPCAALRGFPIAVTPGSPLTKTPSFCSTSETVVEGDSECWLYCDTSLDAHWYGNEYCILSDAPSVLQRSGLVKAEACCFLDEGMSNRAYHNENQQSGVFAMPPYTWEQESSLNV